MRRVLLFTMISLLFLAVSAGAMDSITGTVVSLERNSGMLADVIKRNARTAVLSQEIIEEIMQTFLGNTARFIDYLNTIEPFSSDELASFAQEAGLTGIRR